MPNRRDFLTNAAAATAAMLAGRSVTGAAIAAGQAAGKRREVLIGKKRVKVVDIHGHFVAPEELDIIKSTNLAGNISNNLKNGLVLGPERLAFMDQQGIDIQVLSHQGGWWYTIERDLARDLIKLQNERL